MPPVSDVVWRSSVDDGGEQLIGDVVLIAVAVTFLAAVSVCGCRGKKKEEDGGGDGGAEKPKTDEKSAKAEEKKADGGGKATAAGTSGASGSRIKCGDVKSEPRVGSGKKGADVNPEPRDGSGKNGGDVDPKPRPGVPAEEMTKSKPPVVQVPSSKQSKMSTVVGTNPAYQTLVNTSKFEASQAAKTGGGTVMKTAVGTTQTKTTAM